MLTAVRAASSFLRTTKQGSIRDLGQKLVDREQMFVPRKTYHVIGDTSASPANNEAATAVQMSPVRCDVPEAESSDRLPLDTLVSRMRDPTFVARHRRGVSLRETSAHVSPVMLAVCSRDSLYVRSWRAHARRCPSCARIFNYFRISLEVE